MVVTRSAELTPELLEAEMHWLNNVLNKIEGIHNVAAACEIFDVNRFKIYRKSDKVITHLKSGEEKPFIFVFNRN